MLDFFVTELVGIGAIVGLVIWKLTARGTPLHVYFTVWVSWTMALALVAIVPVDLNLVYLKRCIDHYGNNKEERDRACPIKPWRTIGSPKDDDDVVLDRWIGFLKVAWLAVYTMCQFNGWILLSFQSSYVESRHFSILKRLQQAAIENGVFWGVVAVLFSVFLLVLAIMGEDLEYVVYGLMASSNAVCLVLVAVFLGFGLAEAPRQLWQGARLEPSLRRAYYYVFSNHHSFNAAAEDLATKLVQVYTLRRAAASSLRRLGSKIMAMAAEVPFDITSVVLMDPVKGPSIPVTDSEMKLAFLSQLREIEMDETHKQRLTEVDRWFAALEAAKLLPKSAPIFLMQEAMFDAGLTHLGDIDHLDPGVKGEMKGEKNKAAREEAIDRQLSLFEFPGSTEVRRCVIKAVITRNDHLLAEEENLRSGKHEGPDPWEKLSSQSNVDAESWDVRKLVKLRTGVYVANRKYRKTKKKFDRAVKQAILLQDLQRTHEDLMPWSGVLHNLSRAFFHSDKGPEGWAGLKCPVRHQYEGMYALQKEVVWFIFTMYVFPLLRMLAAVLCALFGLAVLFSQVSLFPFIPKVSMPGDGSLLLLHVCSRATLPPNCIQEDTDLSTWRLWVPFRVTRDVQVPIFMHLFFICGIVYFTLLRIRLFSLYEVVIGETDGFSLLFNAYIVCRLAPSIAHNYLAMLREAHETSSVEVTAFEQVFSALGRIPFLGSSFNEVLPPVMLFTFLLTLFTACFRGSCRCPRLDGESHKTEDMIDDARLIVELERKRYEKNRAQSRAIKIRKADNGNGDYSREWAPPSKVKETYRTIRHGIDKLAKKKYKLNSIQLQSMPSKGDDKSMGLSQRDACADDMSEEHASNDVVVSVRDAKELANGHAGGEEKDKRPAWSKKISQAKTPQKQPEPNGDAKKEEVKKSDDWRNLIAEIEDI
ncbi:hypothetical protein GUITHDRAFT_145891 [Guillardia theta CCMP2712]|uniref:Uncharacterized protein n=3 Tax=Guillardia theta TaxID=55529 RepID=L1IJC7_GUITC|nr:hypothetical protein GUITHDRAFT_145891 [Guillardia theta CCMP2712]EKX36326.1 hypothetical protein GUITHDRAFT_145891 [Guillardia theta CCMP2712]|eukprot:XP_005823306.1 hypothetical protein GUITHDRAFT_145891 [Guillardia theta CCMP2712]